MIRAISRESRREGAEHLLLPTTGRKGAAVPVIAFVAVIVIIAASVATMSALVSEPRRQPKGDGPPFAYACSEPYSGVDSASSNSSAVQPFPIISVPLGHVAVLCVTYYYNVYNKAQVINLNGTLLIGTMGAFPYSGCSGSPCTSYHFVDSTDFSVRTNVSSLALGGGGASEATVAYAIIPTTASPGFYWLFVPYLAPTSCPVEFPFAYGFSFNDGNSTGQYFPLPDGYGGDCIAYLSNYYSQYPFAHLVGTSSNVGVVSPTCGSYTCDVKPS